MVAAYRYPDKAADRRAMQTLIDSVSTGVPAALPGVRRLGRTLNNRTADALACFDRPRTSNGPTEAPNSRLEHPRGSTLGLRNLTHYIARSLLETGGLRPPPTPWTVQNQFTLGKPPVRGSVTTATPAAAPITAR